jgi:hypothetical protein
MWFMLSMDQIQRELKAILDFDIIFLAASKHYPEEIVGLGIFRPQGVSYGAPRRAEPAAAA